MPILFTEALTSLTFQPVDLVTVDPESVFSATKGKYLRPNLAHALDGTQLFVASSEHGSSQLLIFPSAVQITATFTPKWRKDRSLGIRYLSERIEVLFSLAELLGRSDQLAFVGAQVTVQLGNDAPDNQLIEGLSKYYSADFGPNVVDLQVRSTVVVDDAFYFNLHARNHRSFSISPLPNSLVRLDNDDAEERGIELQGDFNSRLAFNTRKSARVSSDDVRYSIEEVFTRTQLAASQVNEKLKAENGE